MRHTLNNSSRTQFNSTTEYINSNELDYFITPLDVPSVPSISSTLHHQYLSPTHLDQSSLMKRSAQSDCAGVDLSVDKSTQKRARTTTTTTARQQVHFPPDEMLSQVMEFEAIYHDQGRAQGNVFAEQFESGSVLNNQSYSTRIGASVSEPARVQNTRTFCIKEEYSEHSTFTQLDHSVPLSSVPSISSIPSNTSYEYEVGCECEECLSVATTLADSKPIANDNSRQPSSNNQVEMQHDFIGNTNQTVSQAFFASTTIEANTNDISLHDYKTCPCSVCLYKVSTESQLESKESQIASFKEIIDSKDRAIANFKDQLEKSLTDKSEQLKQLESSNLNQMNQKNTEVYNLSAENQALRNSLEAERKSWPLWKDKFEQMERTAKLDQKYFNQMEMKLKQLTFENEALKSANERAKLEQVHLQFIKDKYEQLKLQYYSNLKDVAKLEGEAKQLSDQMETLKSENENVNVKLTKEADKLKQSNYECELMDTEINKLKEENRILQQSLQLERDSWKLLNANCEQLKQSERTNQENADKLKNAVKNLMEEISAMKFKFVNEQDKLKQANEQQIQKINQWNQVTVNQLKSEVKNLTEENGNLKRQFAEEHDKLVQLDDKCEHLTEENVNLNKSLVEQSEKLEQANQTIADNDHQYEKHLIEENDNLKLKLLADCAKLKKSDDTCEHLNAEIIKLKDENEKSENKLEKEREFWKMLMYDSEKSNEENVKQLNSENAILRESLLEQANFMDGSRLHEQVKHLTQENGNLKLLMAEQVSKLKQSIDKCDQFNQSNQLIVNTLEGKLKKMTEEKDTLRKTLSSQIEQLMLIDQANQQTIKQLQQQMSMTNVTQLKQQLNGLAQENARLKTFLPMYNNSTLLNKEGAIVMHRQQIRPVKADSIAQQTTTPK